MARPEQVSKAVFANNTEALRAMGVAGQKASQESRARKREIASRWADYIDWRSEIEMQFLREQNGEDRLPPNID